MIEVRQRLEAIARHVPCFWRRLCFLLAFALVGIFTPVALDAQEEVVRLREARLVYHIDRGAVPSWVTARDVTLRVEVGPALDVVALSEGLPVPCAYDGEYAVVTTGSDEVELFVAAPDYSLAEMGQVSVAPLRGDKQWAFSLTLDDGYVSQATTARALLDRYGYRATIAVVGSWIGETRNGHTYASAEQLQGVVEDGWHLSNHTDNHYHAAEIGDADDIVANMQAANRRIEQAVPGYTPIMFTCPYVDTGFVPVVEDHVEELGFRLVQTLGWEAVQVDPGAEFSPQDEAPASIGRTQLLNDASQFDEVHSWTVADPDTHWWLSLHSHDVPPACDCVETALDRLYYTYGAGGMDEVWVAPAPEVYQYLLVRDRVVVEDVSREMVGQPPEGYTLPTPEPMPTPRKIVFQEDHEDYQGTRDTTISSYPGEADMNYGADWALRVRTLAEKSTLLRFDLEEIPAHSIIERATLGVYGLAESNEHPSCLAVHPLLRPWDEDAATWYRADADTLWAQPGAMGSGEDAVADHVGLRGLAVGLNRWYAVDITEAVQDWVEAPEENHGFALRGAGGSSREVSLVSSDHDDAARRPKLTVTYRVPPTSTTPTLPGGDALLVGKVLLEGRGQPPSPRWSVPLTVTLHQGREPVHREVLSTGENGEFVLEGLPSGSFDLRVDADRALPMVRQGITLSSGLNMVTVGPLVEGDVVKDGYIGGRDWARLVQVLATRREAGGVGEGVDLNGDGEIDTMDVSILSHNYGRYGDVVQTTSPGHTNGPPPREALLWLTPDEAQMDVGERVTYSLMLDAGEHAVDGVDLRLSFDSDYLSLAAITTTEAFPDLLPGCDLEGGDGKLRYVAGNLQQPVSGTLPILRFSLEGVHVTPQDGTAIALGSSPHDPPRVASRGYDILGEATGARLHVNREEAVFMPHVRSVRSVAGASSVVRDYEGAIDLSLVGYYPLNSSVAEARDVKVRDSYAYMVVAPFYANDRFVYVMYLTDPRMPEAVNIFRDFAHKPDEICLQGDRAYVANKGRGVSILDISDPPEIESLGTFATGEPLVKGVFATTDYLYVADEHGLQIVDVSEPGDPELLINCKPDEVFGEGVWSDDEVAYVAANHFRVHADEGHPVVQVFDVSDPYRPYRCSAPVAPIPGRAVDVDVEGERLYVAAENGGVVVYDLSDPCDPSYLGAFDTRFAQKLRIVDGIVFVADGEGGLVVVDASDPQQMHAVGQCQTVDRAFGVDVAHGYAYVADGTAGLRVVDLSPLTPTPAPTLTPTPTATPTRTPLPTVPPSYTHMPLVFK